MERLRTDAKKYIWEGAITLQISLHDSEVTTLPPPPPALILAPRIGFLPLLIPHIKPHFSGTLPPGVDTIWFDYKGLPLKWYMPTGVLFDLLCPEPERPWNLTVHFRGYPADMLIPYEGEDSIKWSFINSLKEAAYIINGNCKNVMNMSQFDQVDLWNSVLHGNLETYLRISSKLKLPAISDEYTVNQDSCLLKFPPSTCETDITGPVKTGKVPVRLYVWSVSNDFDDLEDAPPIDSWDQVSYINRPVETYKEEGKCFTLGDAMKALLPEVFPDKQSGGETISDASFGEELRLPLEDASNKMDAEKLPCNIVACPLAELKLLRIQGIEPKLELPFSWVANNLTNPEHFLHVCVCVKAPNLVS